MYSYKLTIPEKGIVLTLPSFCIGFCFSLRALKAKIKVRYLGNGDSCGRCQPGVFSARLGLLENPFSVRSVVAQLQRIVPILNFFPP